MIKELLLCGAALAIALATVSAGEAADEGVTRAPFGMVDGKSVEIFTLTNRSGMVAKIMTYGATLTELHTPDRNGHLADVTLGFDNLDAYVKGHPFFGSTVGRVANRIAKGEFTLDGKTYKLAVNNGPNHLHGGLKAFDKQVWDAETVPHNGGPSVRFTYTDPDGHEGYPGTVKVTVTYTLTNLDALRIDYTATTDQATPINLTNHTYFNLAEKGDVLGHELKVDAQNYTPSDATLIPTGQIAPVAGTPLDFTKVHTIGERIADVGKDPTGYDHNFVVDGKAGTMRRAALVHDPQTGRVMEVFTTEPGVQFYTGNFLDGTLTGKGGHVYDKHSGFCLETQHYPDSINKPNFPSVVLRPGQTFTSRTEYRFSTRK